MHCQRIVNLVLVVLIGCLVSGQVLGQAPECKKFESFYAGRLVTEPASYTGAKCKIKAFGNNTICEGVVILPDTRVVTGSACFLYVSIVFDKKATKWVQAGCYKGKMKLQSGETVIAEADSKGGLRSYYEILISEKKDDPCRVHFYSDEKGPKDGEIEEYRVERFESDDEDGWEVSCAGGLTARTPKKTKCLTDACKTGKRVDFTGEVKHEETTMVGKEGLDDRARFKECKIQFLGDPAYDTPKKWNVRNTRMDNFDVGIGQEWQIIIWDNRNK